MKAPFFSILLLFVLVLVHHSSEQEANPEPTLNEYENPSPAPVASNRNGVGLIGVLRNQTNVLLTRLEGPRDRVLEFIKPAVKSDFSRNVTNVLNSIWSRIQGSNNRIIQNPLIRNTVVLPINTTLARLKEITASENENSNGTPNVEIIGLNTPEDQERIRDYFRSSSNSAGSASSSPVIFLFRDNQEEKEAKPFTSEGKEVLPDASEENEVSEAPIDRPHDEVNNDDTRVNEDQSNNVDHPTNEKPIDQSNDSVRPPIENPTKSVKKAKRSFDSNRNARYVDNGYELITPDKTRSFLDSVRKDNQRSCLAWALCQADCQRHQDERRMLLKNLFESAESSGSLREHTDYDYYLRARQLGRTSCEGCSKFKCSAEREQMLKRYFDTN